MLGRGLSPRTVRYTHSVLRSALNQAVKWGLLYRNPADLVDLPKQQKKEIQVLTPEEAARFMEAAVYSRWKALFSLLISSGMRPGEALGLKWQDIDFAKGRVHVRRALTKTKEGWQLTEPKTPKSRRTIPLPAGVMQDLKEHKKEQAAEKLRNRDYQDYDLVFASEKGTPLDLHNIVRRHFKPLLKDAGLPDINIYALRHTCATLLLMAGENPKVVSERLGHSSVTMTLDTYSHVLPDMQEEATKKLEGILFNGRHPENPAHNRHTIKKKKKKKRELELPFFSGEPWRIRTSDTLIKSYETTREWGVLMFFHAQYIRFLYFMPNTEKEYWVAALPPLCHPVLHIQIVS